MQNNVFTKTAHGMDGYRLLTPLHLSGYRLEVIAKVDASEAAEDSKAICRKRGLTS